MPEVRRRNLADQNAASRVRTQPGAAQGGGQALILGRLAEGMRQGTASGVRLARGSTTYGGDGVSTDEGDAPDAVDRFALEVVLPDESPWMVSVQWIGGISGDTIDDGRGSWEASITPASAYDEIVPGVPSGVVRVTGYLDFEAGVPVGGFDPQVSATAVVTGGGFRLFAAQNLPVSLHPLSGSSQFEWRAFRLALA